MHKYQAIFSGETHLKEKTLGRCAFVISLSFHQSELPRTNAQENTPELRKFSAVLKRLNSAFDDIDIILSDTLNRHNASIYFPGDDPEKKSLALGDAWLQSAYFRETDNSLTKKSLIKRWNELVSEKYFNDVKKIIEALYKENPKFSSTVDSVSANFVAFLCNKRKKILVDRNSQTNPMSIDYSNFNMEEAYKNCLPYILEECAVTLVFRLNGYSNLFHIGKVNDAVDWAAKNTINLGAKHSDLIKAINDNPLKIVTVSKYKSCQYSTPTDSDKIKSKEESNLLHTTIFKKNIISRRKTFPDITKENQPSILRRRTSTY